MPPADSDTVTTTWKTSLGPAEIRTLGRGPTVDLAQPGRSLGSATRPTAWLDQIHSARVLEARPGACGAGDALRTREADLVLCIVTADCVPVVLVNTDEIAAIHAGWRGIVAGIVPAALETFTDPPPFAWIGPAIGPCCYEVGDDVAADVERVAGASSVVRPGTPRPFVALQRAVELQLRAEGVGIVMTDRRCTRCSPDLWSYRGDGPGPGRNVTAAWLRSP